MFFFLLPRLKPPKDGIVREVVGTVLTVHVSTLAGVEQPLRLGAGGRQPAKEPVSQTGIVVVVVLGNEHQDACLDAFWPRVFVEGRRFRQQPVAD